MFHKILHAPPNSVAIGIGFLTFFGVTTSLSPLVVLTSGLAALFIFAVLWRPGELPILLVPVLLQFTAVALKPIMTAFTGGALQDLAEFDASLEPAALFALAGISALAFGLAIGTRGPKRESEDKPVLDLSFRRIIRLTLAAIILGHLLDLLAEKAGGARQILLGLGGLKWAGLFVMAYLTLHHRRGFPCLGLVVAIEIVLGMSGFFSEFRLVLFVLLGAALAAHGAVRGWGLIALTIGAALALLLAVFWSAVKKDYREFLNQETGEQVIRQPLDERLAWLGKRASEFDVATFVAGFESLTGRLSYIDFLAATMENVPEVLPHEGGLHLGEAILHVLTPRILFPNKPDVPNDTVMTAYYTKLPLAIYADENTSISIGYLGELYIDFGLFGALAAVFLIGLAYGRGYRSIRDNPRIPRFVNHGLCMMIALAFATFETALVKLVGSLVMVLAATFLIQRIFIVTPIFSRVFPTRTITFRTQT